MEKDNFSYIHTFLYKLFKEEAKTNFVSYHEIREILRRRLHKIPRYIHYKILNEMEGKTINIPPLIKRMGSCNGRNIYYELTGKNIDKSLDLPIC